MAISRFKFRMYANKKGVGIDDTIAFIIFIFVAAIGIFFFRFNEDVKSAALADDIVFQKDILKGHEALMEYMSKADKQNNKADLVSKYAAEKNYDALKRDINDYFSKKLVDLNWYIEVKDSSGNLLFPALTNAQYTSAQEQYASTKVARSVALVIVPISNQDYNMIELTFAR